jgi:hypothetical protein
MKVRITFDTYTGGPLAGEIEVSDYLNFIVHSKTDHWRIKARKNPSEVLRL